MTSEWRSRLPRKTVRVVRVHLRNAQGVVCESRYFTGWLGCIHARLYEMRAKNTIMAEEVERLLLLAHWVRQDIEEEQE